MNNPNNPKVLEIDLAKYRNKPQKPKPKKKGSKKNSVALVSGFSKSINAPVAKTKIVRATKPDINYARDGRSCVVSHTEFLQDLNGSVDFTTTQIPVNPGLPASFPWLSNIAPNFESYLFESLEFFFEDASNTTYTGTVSAAIDYDASDPAPLSKVQLAAYESYVRSAAWKSFTQISPSGDLKKRSSYYVRTGSLAANQDIKLYDVGNLFIATQGQASAVPVGEIYVRYRVRFTTPQLSDVAVGLSRSAKITNGASNVVAAGSNAPLTPSGLIAAGPTLLTATAPYNCLITAIGGQSSGTPVLTTAGSTCTIQTPASSVTGSTYIYTAELAFAPGQIFSFDTGGGALWTSNVFKVGQYNTLVL
jgi:hypothetical protein